jgi:hypothetical protein
VIADLSFYTSTQPYKLHVGQHLKSWTNIRLLTQMTHRLFLKTKILCNSACAPSSHGPLTRIFVKPSNQMLDFSTILDQGRNDSDGICWVFSKILLIFKYVWFMHNFLSKVYTIIAIALRTLMKIKIRKGFWEKRNWPSAIYSLSVVPPVFNSVAHGGHCWKSLLCLGGIIEK